MKPRILVLPIAAVVIFGLAAWKLNQPPRPRQNIKLYAKAQSPRFELLDQQSKVVKFERYLSRHRIIVIFFDGDKDPGLDPRLVALNDGFSQLQALGDVVVAISGATPHQIRKADKFPFPVLTDINPLLAGSKYMVHKQWGSYNKQQKRPLHNMYVVNRAGLIKVTDDGIPVPEPQPLDAIARLIRGEYYDR